MPSSQFQYLILKYPNCDWDWSNISQTASFSFIQHDLPWDWKSLSKTPNITEEFVRNNTEKRWDLFNLTTNPALFPKFIIAMIQSNKTERKIKLYNIGIRISYNPNLTVKFAQENSHIDWDWKYISKTLPISSIIPQLVMIDLQKNPTVDPNSLSKLNYFSLSTNPGLSKQFIEEHIDEKWDWGHLLNNKVIDMDFVYKYESHIWSIYSLSMCPDLPLSFIKKYIDRLWDIMHLSENKNLTPEFIEKYINKSWNWNDFSNNKNMNADFVIKYHDKNWDWIKLADNESINKKIMMDYYLSNPSLCMRHYISLIADDIINFPMLNFQLLSSNPNLTADIVGIYPNKCWNFQRLMKNPSLSTKNKVDIIHIFRQRGNKSLV